MQRKTTMPQHISQFAIAMCSKSMPLNFLQKVMKAIVETAINQFNYEVHIITFQAIPVTPENICLFVPPQMYEKSLPTTVQITQQLSLKMRVARSVMFPAGLCLDEGEKEVE